MYFTRRVRKPMKYISQIQFGIMTPEEIERISVCEINSSKCNDLSMPNTVYDPRMGSMRHDELCPTCSKPSKDCMGHFGHINLNVRIIHPLYARTVVSFLKCFCMSCYRLIFTEETLALWGYLKYVSDQRFELIVKRADKDRCCQRCQTVMPGYSYSSNQNEYYATYKKPARRVILKVEDIDRVLSSVTEDDITLLGLNPACSHPRSLIIQKLPVIPPRSRPFVLVDGVINDDDLTLQYVEIIKSNLTLAKPDISLAKREKETQTIRFRIMTLMDNSNNKAKHSNHAIKSIKERLSGKEGRIRSNLSGKRCNFSARTVIGPDPTLKIDEISVPHYIADTLTYTEQVNRYNYERLCGMLERGDILVVIRDDCRFVMKYRTNIQLQIGDKVERVLQDGDYVLLNRQPTLHKGSMMAHKIIRRDGKTIRLNLAVTGSFNADKRHC